MSERPSRTPELSKGKQRELRRQQQKRTQKRNRVLTQVGLATAGLATLGAAVGGTIYARHENDNPQTVDQSLFGNDVLDPEYINNAITSSVEQINQALGTNLKSSDVLSNTIIVPRVETLTDSEKVKWCQRFPCQEALASVMVEAEKPKIFLNISLIEYLQVQSGASSDQIKELFKSTTFNEIYHYLTIINSQNPSLEAERVVKDYIINQLSLQNTNATGEDLSEVKLRGGTIDARHADGDDVHGLHILDELYSTLFMEFMMRKIGFVEFYGKGSERDSGRFGGRPTLFDKLIQRLGDNDTTWQKMYSLTTSGRSEEWISFVGSHFTQNSLEYFSVGFKILSSIDREDLEEFNSILDN